MTVNRERKAEPELMTKCPRCGKEPLCLNISSRGQVYRNECRTDDAGMVWEKIGVPHKCYKGKSPTHMDCLEREWKKRHLASLGNNMVPVPAEEAPEK